jgi:hypothetical protein
MSVTGYIGPNKRSEPDAKAIREALEEISGKDRPVEEKRAAPEGIAPKAIYRSVADYDPVLRSHCRLEVSQGSNDAVRRSRP